MKIELEGKVKVIVEKNDKILKKYEQKMNSFLRNLDHILALFFTGSQCAEQPVVTLYDITGEECNIYGISQGIYTPSRIRIGSGTKEVSPDDYALDAEIAYVASQGFTYNSSTRTIVVRGSWVNNTEADKTVTEVGLSWYIVYYYNSERNTRADDFLIIRDLLENSVTVPVGASITVEFTITVKVSG